MRWVDPLCAMIPFGVPFPGMEWRNLAMSSLSSIHVRSLFSGQPVLPADITLVLDWR